MITTQEEVNALLKSKALPHGVHPTQNMGQVFDKGKDVTVVIFSSPNQSINFLLKVLSYEDGKSDFKFKLEKLG